MTSKKLILFDCDGVLVDSEALSNKIFYETLTAYGHTISIEECARRFTGVSARNAREIIMRESAIYLPENYWALQEPKLFRSFETELKALMLPVLSYLEEKGITHCVASNSSRNHVVHCLQVTGQYKYFIPEAIFNAEQVARDKPAPDLFLYAAKTMGFDPKDCLVIEDSKAGIEAALAAGMDVIAFLGGSHAGFDDYKKKISDYSVQMVHSCNDLIEVIEQLCSDNYASLPA